jgi:hydrogenase small subunit
LSEGNTNSDNGKKDLDFLRMDWHNFLKETDSTGTFKLLENYKKDNLGDNDFPDTRVLWIQGAQCTGCSESLLAASDPELLKAFEILNIDLKLHEAFLAHQGLFVNGKPANTSELNSEILIDEISQEGNYILIVEGAIANGPEGSGKYCMVGDRSCKDMFEKAAGNADLIIAVGTCAAYGGINSANSDIADILDYRGVAFTKKDSSKGILQVLGIDKPVINIPGCPPHPDWIIFTLSAVISGNVRIPDDLPEVLDEFGRPKVFFPQDYNVHKDCPRKKFFNNKEFDTFVGGEKCLLKMGCRAFLAHADCTLRKWNDGHSYCVQAGSPCIACVELDFPDNVRPLYSNKKQRKELINNGSCNS